MAIAPLLLGLAGAGAGYLMFGTATFLGLSAAAWGFMIGSTLGSMLFPPKLPTIEGPRLQDFYVPQSDYGAPIPLVFGTVRIQCPLLWVTDIREEKWTKVIGGGKGGRRGQKVTMYDYYVTLACLICEGEISEVIRIWGDGRVIFDARVHEVGKEYVSSAEIKNAIASSKFVAHIYSFIADPAEFKRISVFYGTEDQEPSDVIESYEGVGNVSAYRGLAYVVIEDLHLRKFGNRIPNISVEVSNEKLVQKPVPFQTSSYSNVVKPCSSSDVFIWQDRGVYKVLCIQLPEFPAGSGIYRATIHTVSEDWSTILGTKTLDLYGGFSAPPPSVTAVPIHNVPESFLVDLGDRIAVVIKGYQEGNLIPYDGYLRNGVAAMIGDEMFIPYYTNSGTAGPVIVKAILEDILWVTASSSDLVDSNTNAFFDASTNKLFGIGSNLYEYDYSNMSIVSIKTIPVSADRGAAIGSGFLITASSSASGTVFDVFNVSQSSLSSIGSMTFNETRFVFSYDDKKAIAAPDFSAGGSLNLDILYFDGSISYFQKDNLSNVVSKIISKTKIIPTASVDTTALAPIEISGFAIRKPSQARQAIESLMRAYFFDMAEEDGKLVAKLRSSAPTTTIDLSTDGEASVYSTTPKENEVILGNELELPKKVSVIYMDKDRNYNVGEQNASRDVSYISSKGVQINDFPISATASEAARIAETFLYELWHNRLRYSFTLPIKWAELSPGDTVNIKLDNGQIRTVRLIKATMDSGSVSVEALDHNPNIYTSGKAGWTNPVDSTAPSILPYSAVELMDIPILRDVDNDAGFYVSAAPMYNPNNWPGAAIVRSLDGTSWSELTRIYNGGVIGRTTTVLPDGPTTIWDESSTVTIRLYNGVLNSATEAQVLNGENALLIGNEIVQFVYATQNPDGTYTISKLLRGRRSTEWATTSHSVGERVILLVNDGSVIRINTGQADLNRQYLYKGVTINDTLDSAPTETFTNTGVGLKPFSPAHLRYEHIGGGRFNLWWVRRTRIGGEWNDYSDVPLGEAEERYRVEVWRSGTLNSYTEVTSPSASNIISQDNDVIKVAQMSAIVGPGFYAETTITNSYVPPIILIDYSSIIKGDNPIAYWKFGESSGTTAIEEINNLHGTYSVGASLGQNTIVFDDSSSVRLNASSNDNISVAGNPTLSLSGDMTVELWARVSSTQTSNYPNLIWKIAGTTSSGHANYLLYVDIATQSGRAGFRQTFGTTNYTVFSTNPINDDRIHHIVGVRRADTIEIWIDGELNGTITVPNSAPNTDDTAELVFGYISSNNDNQINAYIDECAIYDYALTRTQIFNHFYYGKLYFYRKHILDKASVVYKMENVLGEDESSNNFDASSLSNITVNNSVVATTDSLASNYFNASYIDLPLGTKDTVPGNGPFSVEIWVNPDTLTGHITAIGQPTLDFGSSESVRWKLKVSVNNSRPEFSIFTGYSTAVLAESPDPISTGTWWHLVGVWDGSYIKLYVNGVLKASAAFSGPMPAASGPVSIGHHWYNGIRDEWYIGYMDEIAIYDYALTDQQVLEHYNSRNNFSASYIDTVLRDGPEVCYRMEDLSIIDSSIWRRDAAIKQDLTLETTNTATADSKGSIYFNGSSSLIEMSSADQNILNYNGFTLEAWTNIAVQGTHNIVFSQGTLDFNSSNLAPIFIAKISNNDKFEFVILTGYTSWVNIFSTTSAVAGNWYHFVCTWDSSTSLMKVYVNGVEENSTTFGGTLANPATPIHIGARYYNNVLGDWFNGYIDEVAIYNRVLRPEEILEHYNARNK